MFIYFSQKKKKLRHLLQQGSKGNPFGVLFLIGSSKLASNLLWKRLTLNFCYTYLYFPSECWYYACCLYLARMARGKSKRFMTKWKDKQKEWGSSLPRNKRKAHTDGRSHSRAGKNTPKSSRIWERSRAASADVIVIVWALAGGGRVCELIFRMFTWT